MFKGTVCQSDNQRSVLIETQSLQRLDVSQLAREVFSLIILKSGSITVKIDQVDCYFEGPAVICLDERKQFEILSNGSIGVDLIDVYKRQTLNICASGKASRIVLAATGVMHSPLTAITRRANRWLLRRFILEI